MQNILKHGAANLLLGADSNNQSTLGAELAFSDLRSGGSVVALVDSQADANALTGECGQWFRARECNAEPIPRLAFVTDYRQHHDPARLADAILKVATGSPLLVWCDLSRGLSVAADHPWLKQAVALLDHLPADCTVLSVISTGPEGMPAPFPTSFPADAIYHVASSGIAMRLTVTPIKPTASPIHLVGRIADGGTVLIDNKETEYA